MGKRLGNNLQMQDIMKIKKIFDDKRWIIDEEEGSVFSRFCRRAAELPDDECRKLFCELSERYCKISDALGSEKREVQGGCHKNRYWLGKNLS